MACNEFTNALAWAQQSKNGDIYPVIAYFTKHYGSGELANAAANKDAVHYASGEMYVINSPTPHLKGTLNGARNLESAELIGPKSNLTYDVEIFAPSFSLRLGLTHSLTRARRRLQRCFKAKQKRSSSRQEFSCTGTRMKVSKLAGRSCM